MFRLGRMRGKIGITTSSSGEALSNFTVASAGLQRRASVVRNKLYKVVDQLNRPFDLVVGEING